MSIPGREEGATGAGRRAVEAAIAGTFVVALTVGVATGMPPVGLAAVAVASVALEYAASTLVTGGILRSVSAGTGDAPADVERVVASVSRDLGIQPPELVYDAAGETGVSVLENGDRTALLVSGPLVAGLDEAGIRGVVSHELAHVALGHLRVVPFREAVGHVVGTVALWVVVLDGLAPGQAVLLAAVYLLAGLTRHNEVSALAYVVGSFGVVLVPMALDAAVSRLEEFEADDVAVALTSATDYCTALYRITELDGETGGGVGARPAAEHRRPLDRLTAVYPTTEKRQRRQGLDVADVAARATDSPSSGPDAGPVSTD